MGRTLTDLKESLEAGYKGYKDGDALKPTVENFVKKQLPGQVKNLMGDQGNFILDAANWAVKNLLPAAPYVGAAMGIFNFFVNGGKTENKALKPSVTETKLSGKGNISFDNPVKDIFFATPGSELKVGDVNVYGNNYHKTLGVINLLETPILEYVEYNPESAPVNFPVVLQST